MEYKIVRSLIILTLSALVLSLTAWTIASSPQKGRQANQADNGRPEQVDETELPIAEFPSPGTASTDTSPLRKLRNKRRDLAVETVDVKKFVLTENSAPVLLQLQESHPAVEPAFPVGQSNAIVKGEVTDAHAYLSGDKTNVCSAPLK